MICFNCLKCILPRELAVIEFLDRDGITLVKKGICEDCGKKIVKYLFDLELKCQEKTIDNNSVND